MIDHTDSQEIVSQIVLAHRALGSWAAVANLLGNNPKTGRPYSPAMAWHFGSGRRPIADTVIEAWQKNVTPAMLKSWEPRKRNPRVSIEVSPEVRDHLRSSIKKDGDTWDDAFLRLLDDREPGNVPHLFSVLSVSSLLGLKDDLDLALYYYRVGDFLYTEDDVRMMAWWLYRLDLELSMRNPPDWARS